MQTMEACPVEELYDVDGKAGVLIGQFQSPELSAADMVSLDHVAMNHSNVIVLVGSRRGVIGQKEAPLPFYLRKQMIEQYNRDITVLPIFDHQCNSTWSYQVDRRVTDTLAQDGPEAILYVIPESETDHLYCGAMKKVTIPQHCGGPSANTLRVQSRSSFKSTADFRLGWTAAIQSIRASAFPTVDIAITSQQQDGIYVVVGRKKSDLPDTYRFPGGFVDPDLDDGYISAAIREAHEEVGGSESNLVLVPDKILDAVKIDAWRYRPFRSKIFTSLVHIHYVSGDILPGDDLDDTVGWVRLDPGFRDAMIGGHKILWDILLKEVRVRRDSLNPSKCPTPIIGGETMGDLIGFGDEKSYVPAPSFVSDWVNEDTVDQLDGDGWG